MSFHSLEIIFRCLRKNSPSHANIHKKDTAFDFWHRQNKHPILPYWCTFRYENLNWMYHFDALNVEISHFHNALSDLDRVVLPSGRLLKILTITTLIA